MDIPPEFDPRIHWVMPISSSYDDVTMGIVHELKHPLNSIKASLALLSQESTKEAYPRARELISQSIARIEWLIETVKVYLKIRPDVPEKTSKEISPDEKLEKTRTLVLNPLQAIHENIILLEKDSKHQEVLPQDLVQELNKAGDDIIKMLDELMA